MDAAKQITPVIVIGGSQDKHDFFSALGRPKPLLKLLSSHSPFQQTVFRAISFRKPVVVCHERYQASVQQQLEEIGVEAEAILVEPASKGEAAALAIASLFLKKENHMMVVMPCGISKPDPHRDILDAAFYAEDRMVLLGGRRTKSAGRYGYILADFKDGDRCHAVKSFIQKPQQTKPVSDQAHSFWSTGILIFRPRFFLNALSSLDLQTFKDCERSFFGSKQTRHIYHIDPQSYARITHNPGGRSILEKIKEAAIVETKSA